ncbi:MAG: DUF4097 domain-containing protein [Gemmatimonadota bacterium]
MRTRRPKRAAEAPTLRGGRSAFRGRPGRVTPLLLAAVAAAAGSAARGQAQERVERERATGPEPYVKVLVSGGSVRVTGWDRETIAVSGSVSRSDRFFLAGGEGSAKLGAWGEEQEVVTADLEVRVPRRSTVWVKTESARVHVSGVTGGVDAYSVTGAVRIEGEARHIYAESMGGPVELFATARSVRAKTANGPILFQGETPDITLTTVAGNISVTAPPLELGRFETVTGEVRFEGGVHQGGSLDFQTHSGTVRLILPADQGADISITSVEGEVHLEGDLPFRHRESYQDLRGRELSFLAGSGGASVIVRTFNGSITLQAR